MRDWIEFVAKTRRKRDDNPNQKQSRKKCCAGTDLWLRDDGWATFVNKYIYIRRTKTEFEDIPS